MNGYTHHQTVLLTGASQGLGKALAYEFARRKYRLVLCSRNIEALSIICDDIQKTGGSAQYIQCDVRDADQMKNAAEFILHCYGHIDMAVLNAGIGISNTFADLHLDNYHNVITTNLSGVLNGINAVVPIMKRQRAGTIVGISSLVDSRSVPGSSAYAVSKSALSLVLESAAIELESVGINVITVRPGFISTALTAGNKRGMPMMMTPERAAAIIVRGIIQRRRNISFPCPMAILSYIAKIMPFWLWRFIFKTR